MPSSRRSWSTTKAVNASRPSVIRPPHSTRHPLRRAEPGSTPTGAEKLSPKPGSELSEDVGQPETQGRQRDGEDDDVVSSGTTTQRRLNRHRRGRGAGAVRDRLAVAGAGPPCLRSRRRVGGCRPGRGRRGRPSAEQRLRRRGQRAQVVGVEPLARRRRPGSGHRRRRWARRRRAGRERRRGAAGEHCRQCSRRAAATSARSPGPWSAGAAAPAPAGRRGSIGAGGSETTEISVAIASPRSNGGRPSTAAYRVAPRDQRSTGGRGSSPLARSGAM